MACRSVFDMLLVGVFVGHEAVEFEVTRVAINVAW